MQQTTNTSINMIQPELAYNPGDFVRTIQQPNYWSQLGSSKNRSPVQQEMPQNIIHEFLSETLFFCFHRWIMSGEPRTLWSWCSYIFSRRSQRSRTDQTGSSERVYSLGGTYSHTNGSRACCLSRKSLTSFYKYSLTVHLLLES